MGIFFLYFFFICYVLLDLVIYRALGCLSCRLYKMEKTKEDIFLFFISYI